MKDYKAQLPLPPKDERRYLMNQKVIVISTPQWFDLAKVRYENDSAEFYIDKQLLNKEPDDTPTININLIGGAP